MNAPTRARNVLLAVAVGRVAIGSAALVQPQLIRLVTGGGPLGPRARALGRMVGVRDLALGVGALAAAPRVEVVSLLAGLGALADAGDAVASLLAAGAVDGDRRKRWLAQAGVAVFSATATSAAVAVARRSR